MAMKLKTAKATDPVATVPVRNHVSDRMTATDRRAMKAARAATYVRLREVEHERRMSIREAFRDEIGATIRSASPFLVSLVASQGIVLDKLVECIRPSRGWPRSPGVTKSASGRLSPVRDPYRHYLVSSASGWTKSFRVRNASHGITFMESDDDWAHLQIIDHSLEVEAQIGPVRFETLFGELRVILEDRLPETLAAACVGSRVGDLVDHASLRGRDWLITKVEDPHGPLPGQTLIVATGAASYRLPRARS